MEQDFLPDMCSVFALHRIPRFLVEFIPVIMILGNQLIKTWWKKPFLTLVIFFINNFVAFPLLIFIFQYRFFFVFKNNWDCQYFLDSPLTSFYQKLAPRSMFAIFSESIPRSAQKSATQYQVKCTQRRLQYLSRMCLLRVPDYLWNIPCFCGIQFLRCC